MSKHFVPTDKIYTIEEITETVAKIVEGRGVKKVILFNDYAIGEADENSHIDLAIDMGEWNRVKFSRLRGTLWNTFEKIVGFFDLNDLEDYSHYEEGELEEEIRETGRLIYESN